MGKEKGKYILITSNFSGNAGNSLTQYVITRCVAEKNSYEFGFNPRFNYDYHNGQNQLSFLNLDYGKIHNANYDELPEGVTNIWQEKGQKITYPNGDSVDFFDYDESIFHIGDGHKLVIPCCQDARYYLPYKDKIQKWLKIKEEEKSKYNQILLDNNIFLDENLCILNVRGGEYLSIPHVLLQKKYWVDAINLMLEKNKDMRFLCVSDDPNYCIQLFDHSIGVVHLGIGGDYFILNNARNLILSNSSFALFPTFLNNNVETVIAPRFWARHNVSTGYWANSNIWTYGWNFLGRNGKLYDR